MSETIKSPPYGATQDERWKAIYARDQEELARLDQENARLRADLEAERRQAQKWLGASRAVTDGTMEELGAAIAELAEARAELEAARRERANALDWCAAALETIAERGCEVWPVSDCYSNPRGPEWVPCSPCVAQQAMNAFAAPSAPAQGEGGGV